MKTVDFGSVAGQYAAHRRADPEVLARVSVGLDSSAGVLEVGCGTGNFISAIYDAVGCRCAAVDPSPEMLATLRARSTSLEVKDGRAERLDWPDAAFDLVFSVDVIHHVKDRASGYREAWRVLGDGGRICTATDSEWIIRSREVMSRYFPETVPIELARYPRIDVLRSEMVAAGFSDIREEITEFAYELTDASAYRDKAFSSLLFLDEESFRRGLARLEADLARGPVRGVSRYLLLWGRKALRTVTGVASA